MFLFTIRDLLWLTVVVALGVGWTVNYRTMQDQIRQRDKAVENLMGELVSAGYSVVIDREQVTVTLAPSSDHVSGVYWPHGRPSK